MEDIPVRTLSPERKSGRITLIEIFLVVIALSMAWWAIVPSAKATSDAIAVERTARTLARVEEAVAQLIKRDPVITNRTQIVIADIESVLAKDGHPPLLWPDGVDTNSLDIAAPSGATVELVLPSGLKRRVSIADLDVDHIN